jgi:hypothetical protein
VVEPSQRTGVETHRSIVPVVPAPSPPPEEPAEPVHFNPYRESLEDLQALRDMLPDDIPLEFQKNVRPAILQLSPSWRQKWARKRERDLQKTMWDNRLKKKIVEQVKIWGPDPERMLMKGEFEVDYVTRYMYLYRNS